MTKMITHPDDFVEGKSYSVRVHSWNGKKSRRVSGKFTKLLVEYLPSTTFPNDKLLCVELKGQRGIYRVSWKHSEDWKEI